MPPVVIIVQFPQQGHKSLSLTQQVYSNSLPHGITLSDGSKTQVIFDCAHMYEKLVNQNLNYVYTRAQSPTGIRLFGKASSSLYAIIWAMSILANVGYFRHLDSGTRKKNQRLGYQGFFAPVFFKQGQNIAFQYGGLFFLLVQSLCK